MNMLSFIIPVFNGASYIEAHVAEALADLRARGGSFEIIVVDDGSTDDTPARLEALAAREPEVRCEFLSHNRGKGAAVKAGVMASRGDYIIFTDADLPYGLAPLPQFVEVLQTNDVALGTREERPGIEGQRTHRTFLSRLFASLANVALRERVPDTQAGFKGFTARAAKEIFARVTIPRFGFDVEIIAIAQKMRLRIASVPVVLINQAPSTVRVGSDGLRMLADLVYIFVKYRLLT